MSFSALLPEKGLEGDFTKSPGTLRACGENLGALLLSREEPEQSLRFPEPVAPARQGCALWPLGEGGLLTADT